MATLNLELRKRGRGLPRPVTFVVYSGGVRKRIPTSLEVEEKDLSRDGKRVKNVQKAMLIEKMRRTLQDKMDAILADRVGTVMTADELVRLMTLPTEGPEFFGWAEDWLGRAKIKGKENYKTLLNKFATYLGRRRILFSAIRYETLAGFERYLDGKPRAQSLYLGGLRHLYREAMRELNTDDTQVITNDPFARYRVPRQALGHGVRALELPQLLDVLKYRNIARPSGRAQLARDCFALSFCLMGMNAADLYEVRDCSGGYLRYKRVKTRNRRSDEAYIEVRVHPALGELMRKYRGNTRVFNFYTRYKDGTEFCRALDVGLKEVGEAVGIPGLTFYQARHTFATLSRNLLRISKSDVDEALNHVGNSRLADVYIKKDFAIINENLFALIDRVLAELAKSECNKGIKKQ